ncbi:hypothetical protein CTDIVETGP_0224 [Clostridium tyrobutyricum DIVETGP]|jgi:hypothetical protein|uniref:Uncharacterized protein n=1 Tax=Clostridium tyrobutyricum DIVETGP TaxID=1408889 RepID=W6N4T9_CLOTY|nr:hypothetical protein CTK_C18020 [Clostridium tyrobutyricum]QCH27558.1 hypothetical protein EZN00_01156 [Clostridium tyrobutyricum]CDL90154.1 hypothetical protein CTDIVETGP_0224 [Clostridium tyrobutyricum DIVETGP]
MNFSIVIFLLILGAIMFLFGLRTKNHHMITSGSVIIIFLLLISINIYIPHTINCFK